jgi:hypothetical protein
VAVDGAGRTLAAGSFQGLVDFGTGPLQASGTDLFVVLLGP